MKQMADARQSQVARPQAPQIDLHSQCSAVLSGYIGGVQCDVFKATSGTTTTSITGSPRFKVNQG
jgi:hypothetical protein